LGQFAFPHPDRNENLRFLLLKRIPGTANTGDMYDFLRNLTLIKKGKSLVIAMILWIDGNAGERVAIVIIDEEVWERQRPTTE
jgi:hypothetical protein